MSSSSSSPYSPVAIVTGGSSGIGHALSQHLLAQNWRVAVADVQPPPSSHANQLYIKTDISSWDEQADMFSQVFAWGKRLDFCALNAGVPDRDDLFGNLSFDEKQPPAKPSMLPFNVNVLGTYYGIKLASHYMSLDCTSAGKSKPGGKIIVTASGGGLFPLPALPQYSSSKHALVGLVRSLAKNPSRLKDGPEIRVNAVCPAIVDTPILPKAIAAHLGPDQLTPMSTVIDAFDVLGDFRNVREDGWVEKGYVGETVEANVRELIWHYPLEKEEGKGGGFKRGDAMGIVADAFGAKAGE